jgi:hypothetical protein
MADKDKNLDYLNKATARDSKKRKSGKSVNSAAFTAGFKYGKGQITKAEAQAIIKKSSTKDLTLGKYINAKMGGSELPKAITKASASATKGAQEARREGALERRGKEAAVKNLKRNYAAKYSAATASPTVPKKGPAVQVAKAAVKKNKKK